MSRKPVGTTSGGHKRSPRKKAVKRRKPAASAHASTRSKLPKTQSSKRKRRAAKELSFLRFVPGVANSNRQTSKRRSSKEKRPLGAGLLQFMGSIFYPLGFLAFVSIFAVIASVYHYSQDLPSITKLDALKRPPQMAIYDYKGQLITVEGDDYGDPVQVSELPPHVVQAFLATEDRNFYHHIGVNPFAILRAVIVNVQYGEVRQGGSTITQQFVKNALLTSDRHLKRKIQEMLLSIKIEMRYEKDEILALYLNNVYYGSGTYGLRAAANRYFDKEPSELNVGEAAMLAGLLKAPTRYSPAANPKRAKQRAKVVIAAMVDAGFLSREEADAIVLSDIETIKDKKIPAPYAVDYVIAEYKHKLGTPTEDVRIETTLNLDAHEQFAVAVDRVSKEDKRFTQNIQFASIAMENDGAIRLLVGGREYMKSAYNRAIKAKRQPGSAFKPFVYLTALMTGAEPTDLIEDSPIIVDDWAPANYKDKYLGEVPIAEAMARSLNAAVIRMQEYIGRDMVISTVRQLGFQGELAPGAALALGVNAMTPMELATTYLPFANDGSVATPYVIATIYDKDGRIIYAHENVEQKQVIPEHPLRGINYMLHEVILHGSGRGANIPHYTVYGKTGTTQDSRDAWFAGHTAGLVGVVWMGKDDYSPMEDGPAPVNGSGPPARLWKYMMTSVLDGRVDAPIAPWQPLPPPAYIHEEPIILVNQEAQTDRQDSVARLIQERQGVPESNHITELLAQQSQQSVNQRDNDRAVSQAPMASMLSQTSPDHERARPTMPQPVKVASMDNLLASVMKVDSSMPNSNGATADPFESTERWSDESQGEVAGVTP